MQHFKTPRKRFLCAALVSALLVGTCSLVWVPGQGLAQTAEQRRVRATAKVKRSTVFISHTEGHGSGFIATRERWIITNEHVVSGWQNVRIETASGQVCIGDVVAINEVKDLAIIEPRCKITAPPLKLVPSRRVQMGQDVLVVGSPGAGSGVLDFSLSRGTVSSVRGGRFIQTDAAMNPGNSGGPVANSRGDVIGVAVGVIREQGQQGLNMAVAAEHAKSLIHWYRNRDARARRAARELARQQREAQRLEARWRKQQAQLARAEERRRRAEARAEVRRQRAEERRAAEEEAREKREERQRAARLLRRGKTLFEQGKLSESLEALNEAYWISDNPEILLARARVHEGQDDERAALNDYRKFLENSQRRAGLSFARERVAALEQSLRRQAEQARREEQRREEIRADARRREARRREAQRRAERLREQEEREAAERERERQRDREREREARRAERQRRRLAKEQAAREAAELEAAERASSAARRRAASKYLYATSMASTIATGVTYWLAAQRNDEIESRLPTLTRDLNDAQYDYVTDYLTQTATQRDRLSAASGWLLGAAAATVGGAIYLGNSAAQLESTADSQDNNPYDDDFSTGSLSPPGDTRYLVKILPLVSPGQVKLEVNLEF